MVPTVEEMLVSHHQTIEHALKVIDKNAQGICFVVGDKKEFLGVVSDGDIRRGLLKGSDLQTPLTRIMNSKAFTLPVTTADELIQASLTDKVRYIPLLDEKNVPVDYACSHRLHRIPIMEPVLGGNELSYVTECIKSGWISSKGSFVGRFEESMAKFCHVPHMVAVSNGTVALHLALEALGIGEGDEVIVPDFTFAASINAVIYTGATPVLVDIDPETWTINIEEIKKAITPKTRAIMPVHIYGHPCDMDAIMAIAREHNILVVEDCAEALGSYYKGKPVGSFGEAATFSFFGNKVITTGEGGMVCFKHKAHFEKGKILRDHGMSPEKRYWHQEVGFNYRMTNLQAAIGVAQMEQLGGFLQKRKEMAGEYDKAFHAIAGVKPQPLKDWAVSCHWLYTVLVDESTKQDRDDLIRKLLLNGIETRPTFYPLHVMPPYQKYAGNRSFRNCQEVSRRGISLPSSVTIEISEIKNIARRIHSLLDLNSLR